MPRWIVLGRSPRSKKACRATARASDESDDVEADEEVEEGDEVEKTALQLERIETSIAQVWSRP